MSAGRLWLIRHAASDAPAGVAIGAGDPPLSSIGLAQVARLIERMRDVPLGAVWSSDSSRARDTATAIASSHGLSVLVTPALREIDFGSWEGRFLGDLWQEDPEAAGAWESDLRQTPPGFGETAAQLEERVAGFWSEHEPMLAGRDVAVVAHRGSLAALRSAVTGCSLADAFGYEMAPGSVATLDL
ncbi:MAG TPA: histidine phosphatase family protein [Candidatus Dormibacteraeota bacterium]|nr:histidine phosphatase family protein [Candidatus Dormibacteraeota bacterium]